MTGVDSILVRARALSVVAALVLPLLSSGEVAAQEHVDATYNGNAAKVPVFPPDVTYKGHGPAKRVHFPDRFIRGFAVGAYGALPELPYKTLFDEMRDLGATHVSIVVAWSQPNVRASVVRRHPTETIKDDELKQILTDARLAGLKVMLFPILHMERRREGEWRGVMEPRDLERWWSEYSAFILHYAQIADETGCEVLSIGSELLSREHETERWRTLSRAARKRFSGKLTYSANWDHFGAVPFWDALDIAGMTGYFELLYTERLDLEEVTERWAEASDVIAAHGEIAGKPVILTEVGYVSRKGALAKPWDYTTTTPVDLETQFVGFLGLYEAYRRRLVNKRKPLGLDGVFIWNWYGYGGPEDGQYTPRGKPASGIIRRWFKSE